jgi:acyl dehydratase
MALKTDAIGKTWPAVEFAVDAERVRQYAGAVGETNPVYHDPAVAKAAGFRDLVAPPMFCVVYSAPAIGPVITDPDVEMNLMAMVHGGQEFAWGEPVCAGDVISTEVACRSIEERVGRGFYVFESVSRNEAGAETVRGTWTNIVRGV